MAKLQFFKGALTGKLGEFVGSKWKGINYLRMYAKPANPRTEGQISIRKVFKSLSAFAQALFSFGLLDLIPPARRMTEKNSVFKANRQMLTSKTFVPEALQAAPANLKATVSELNARVDDGVVYIDGNSVIQEDDNAYKVAAIVYNPANGAAVGCLVKSAIVGRKSLEIELEVQDTGNFTEDYIKANCRAYVFVSGTSDTGKKFISKTFSCDIA